MKIEVKDFKKVDVDRLHIAIIAIMIIMQYFTVLISLLTQS